MAELRESDLAHLRRVASAGGEAFMGYGETGSTLRLAELGLLRWWQSSAFVATVALTDAGRELLDRGAPSSVEPLDREQSE